MIAIKNLFFNKDFKNLFFLVIQNIANYLFPFITFSYLIRTIGFEKFGLITFVSSIFNYFNVAIEYGFAITATKDISLNQDNVEVRNKVVSSVLSIKTVLFIASMIILGITYPINVHMQHNLGLYVVTIFFLIGQSFNPIWFFQGIQNLKTITIINVVIKFIQIFLIFMFVRNEHDYLNVQIINAASLILVLLLLYFIMIYKYNYKFEFIGKALLLKEVREGWYMFISNVSVTLYTTTITALLGFFHGNIYVGYYSAAEKIIVALKGLTSPLSQIVYPKVVIMSKKSKISVLKYNQKLLFLGVIPFFIFGLIILFFSKELLFLVFHKFTPEVDVTFKILSFLPLIILMHSLFSLCTLLVFGEHKIYMRIIISAGILNLIVGTTLIYFFKHIGAAISVITIEMYILILYIYFTNKRGLSLFKKYD